MDGRVQVYRARLASTGQEVAVKVQRPNALSTISKVRMRTAVSSACVYGWLWRRSASCCGVMQDLYVMRRAVVIYERLIRRFTAQTTDYQVLLSTFAGTRPAVMPLLLHVLASAACMADVELVLTGYG